MLSVNDKNISALKETIKVLPSGDPDREKAVTKLNGLVADNKAIVRSLSMIAISLMKGITNA
jgi:hypothetical protein